MEGTFQIVFYIALIVFVIILHVISLNSAKENIHNDLQLRGAKDIIIQHQWFDFDRDTMTFSVEFTNSTGIKHRTHCKLRHRGIFLDTEIYWSNILDLDPKQMKELSGNQEVPTLEISTALAIPNSEDIIVMMKYVSAFRNVRRLKPDGFMVWEAELPTDTGDVYTNIAWQDGQLTAYSRSCISVILDVNTGKIVSPKKH